MLEFFKALVIRGLPASAFHLLLETLKPLLVPLCQRVESPEKRLLQDRIGAVWIQNFFWNFFRAPQTIWRTTIFLRQTIWPFRRRRHACSITSRVSQVYPALKWKHHLDFSWWFPHLQVKVSDLLLCCQVLCVQFWANAFLQFLRWLYLVNLSQRKKES